jgi:hypothetical protein
MEPEQYGTLNLRREVLAKNGATVHDLVIYRPTAKFMLDVLDTPGNTAQTTLFMQTCVRALNGGSEPLELAAALELDPADGSEINDTIAAMVLDADKVRLPPDTGDGITAPLVYTLHRPLKLSPREDAETLTQIQFEARRMREVTEFLDATTRGEQFRAFMRLFGKPMGIAVPIMTDVLINALDFVDYFVIRGPLIMGKLTGAQGRWKKTPSPLH